MMARTALVAILVGVLLAGTAAAAVVVVLADSPTATGPVPHLPPDAYANAVDAAARRGLHVWLEADLVKRWQEGPAALADGVRRLAVLAARPGVVGVKIADELGYRDGLDRDPAGIARFLDATSGALRAAIPGVKVLADLVVPELGCVPGVPAVSADSARCVAGARDRYPALALPRVDGYLASGDLDVLDLSTGLLDDSVYRGWGVSATAAQEAAWREVARRGWAGDVTLQARKAMAHPGPYAGSAERAEADLRLFVDLPGRLGAGAVDVWTWRQAYDGSVVRLMDPGLRTNPLWNGLVRRHDDGARLFTHFTPSSVEEDTTRDLATLSRAFSSVFVAAGIG